MAVLIHSALCDAMESVIVQVESGYMRGFAGLQLIGHASEVCRHGVERARAALEQIGITMPPKRIVLSLSPAEVKKDGSQFDLAFAVALARLADAEPCRSEYEGWLFVSELGLEGELRPVKNVVSFILAAVAAGLKGVVLSRDNLPEALALTRLGGAVLGHLRIEAFSKLGEVLAWFSAPLGGSLAPRPQLGLELTGEQAGARRGDGQGATFDDMILSPALERLALVVATGLHSLLLYGIPGSGKSMFSSRLTSIFPLMEAGLHLDALRIHSCLAHYLATDLLAGRPPFRSPHHQASASALLGIPERPGEVSLAHGGVLFLDEFPEFRRDIIEALREPLETGLVRVSRAKRKVVWKSEITLVAACNLCPCGWYGSSRQLCSCPSSKIMAYRRRLSGPILDRIDLHMNMPEGAAEKAQLFLELARRPGEPAVTARLAEKVLEAREFGRHRNRRWGVVFNRDLQAKDLMAALGLDEGRFRKILQAHLSPHATSRGLIKTLRVARTLADLEEAATVRPEDLILAAQWQAEGAARGRGDQMFG